MRGPMLSSIVGDSSERIVRDARPVGSGGLAWHAGALPPLGDSDGARAVDIIADASNGDHWRHSAVSLVLRPSGAVLT